MGDICFWFGIMKVLITKNLENVESHKWEFVFFFNTGNS